MFLPSVYPIPQPSPGEDDEQPEAPPSDDERTWEWVVEQYMALGFTQPAAVEFANAHACWHDAQRLLARGWTHEQIVAVLL